MPERVKHRRLRYSSGLAHRGVRRRHVVARSVSEIQIWAPHREKRMVTPCVSVAIAPSVDSERRLSRQKAAAAEASTMVETVGGRLGATPGGVGRRTLALQRKAMADRASAAVKMTPPSTPRGCTPERMSLWVRTRESVSVGGWTGKTVSVMVIER